MSKNPHNILNDILIHNFPGHILLCKDDGAFKSANLVSTYLFQLRHAISLYLIVLKNLKKKYILREYDNFSLILVFLPAANLSFNVNHNLQTRIGKLVTRILALRFDICFIDASQQTMQRYPFLSYVPSNIKQSSSAQWDESSVLILVGSREEQRKGWTVEDIDKVTEHLKRKGITVNIVGRNHSEGCYMPDGMFSDMLSKSVVICWTTYEERHAGTIWQLKASSPMILYRFTESAKAQLSGHSEAVGFKGINDLIRIIETRL